MSIDRFTTVMIVGILSPVCGLQYASPVCGVLCAVCDLGPPISRMPSPVCSSRYEISAIRSLI